MLSSKKRYSWRVLLAPLLASVLVLSRSVTTLKGVALAVGDWLRTPVQAHRLGAGPEYPEAKTARERLVNMIAIVVFAVAAQSAIFGLAHDSGNTSARLPPLHTLERAAAPAARDRRPLLSVGLHADPAYIPVGGTVTYTLEVTYTSANSEAADDVVVSNALPSGLSVVQGPVCSPASADRTATCRYDSATRTVTARMTALDVSRQVVQITYAVRADDGLPCGSPIHNVVEVTWREGAAGLGHHAESSMEISVSRGGDGSCPAELPGSEIGAGGIESFGALSARSAYVNTSMFLDIPRLGLNQMDIVDVPLSNGTWDISWLGNSAGWLETTSEPGQPGNSVITAHVTDIYGQDGPFANLHMLAVGDEIQIDEPSKVSTYLVQSVREVAPDDLSVLNDSGLPLLTLLTCAEPNYTTHTYDARLVVQALMIRQDEQ
jgi:LPXTG-site transpeptidase (sortase) family protein